MYHRPCSARRDGARPNAASVSVKCVLALWVLAACAGPPGASVTSTEQVQAPTSELVGYLLYIGEFEIYPTDQVFRQGLGGAHPPCVSGIFSDFRRHELLSRRFNGRKVRLVGHFEDWAAHREIFMRMDPLTEGTPILQNDCGGERVFFADDASPAD
jgi:hypothetical protein